MNEWATNAAAIPKNHRHERFHPYPSPFDRPFLQTVDDEPEDVRRV